MSDTRANQLRRRTRLVLSAVLLFGSTAALGSTAAIGTTTTDRDSALESAEPHAITQPDTVSAEDPLVSEYEMMADYLGVSVEEAQAIGVFSDYAGSLEALYLATYPEEFTGIVIDPLSQTMTLYAKAELIKELTTQQYDYPVVLVESQYSAQALEEGATELAHKISDAGFSADVAGDIETGTVVITTSPEDRQVIENYLLNGSTNDYGTTSASQSLLGNGAVLIEGGITSRLAIFAP